MTLTAGKRNCRNCYFARLVTDGLYCVKNAPTVECATGCACWAVVKAGDICGQFRYADDNLIEQDHRPRDQVPIYRDQYWKKIEGRWAACIKSEGKKKHPGNFESEAEAAKAYDTATKKYHGEYALLNFPH